MNNVTDKLPMPGPAKAFPMISDWLRFDPDGSVQVYSGRVELGQGITTALAQIVAEELDVPVSAIRMTLGDTRTSPAEGPTVGSLSVQLGGMSLRMAASAARQVMLRRAADLTQSAPEALSVDGGAILNGGVETGLGYGGLAGQVDLAVPLADHAAPKAKTDRHISGQSVARSDLAARLGAGYMIHDLSFDGMLHGRVVQPPSLDARLDSDPATLEAALTQGSRLVTIGGFIGVVADHEYHAIRDARTLADHVRWNGSNPADAPHPTDALEHPEPQGEVLCDTGDGPKAAAETISVTLTKPVLSHASIGPSCGVARWDDGRLTVWAHSQNVFALKGSLAAVLRVDPGMVDVIFAPAAGCYGHNAADDAALDAALLSRECDGAPMRVLWTRADDFRHAPLNPAMKTCMSATLSPDGRIASFRAQVISPPHSTRPGGGDQPNLRSAAFLPDAFAMGPGNDAPQPQGGADRNAIPPYAIPSCHVTRTRPTEVPYRPSAMRGLGSFTNIIALETLVDQCAEAAGQDPLAYRIAHLDDPRAHAVIHRAAAMAGLPSAGIADLAEGEGLALAYSRYKNMSGYLACVARVEIADEVRVTDLWAAADVGEVINPDGAINQIEGGMIQAISWTLKEEVTFAGGQNLVARWEDYPILPFSEVPRMAVELLDQPEAPVLGAGEISAGPAGAAVVGAVRRALGVTPTSLPLNRHALISLLSAG